MMRHSFRGPLLRVLIVLSAATLGGACSREGSANPDALASAGEPAGGAVTQWTDSVELFMEYPALIVGAPGKFNVHLTDITDFQPLRTGTITLRFQPRAGGIPLVVRQEVPRAPGIYGPAPAFTQAGLYDLTLLVNSPQAKDSLTVSGIPVYAGAAEATRAEGETESGGSSGIVFLKEQQWKTPGFRTSFARTGSVQATFEAAGDIAPAAGRFADVRAPISGLVDVGSITGSPVPGQRVARGQVLAHLVPSLGEGGSSYAEARARLREAEDEFARAKRLVEAEAAPLRRLHEAEIRLQAAREALAGFGGGAAADGSRVAVRAPVSGVVAQRTIAPGSRVEAGSPLFTIVDPSVVWLTVHVPAPQASVVSGTSGALFQIAGSSRIYATRRVVAVGSIIDARTRTLSVIFEAANPDRSIKVGATARAQIRTGERATGVVIPASAILDEDGRPIAYVQAEGERFEKRGLVLGGREGDRVLVASGIRAGERVVTGAAYQVRLASLSTSLPAQGHEH